MERISPPGFEPLPFDNGRDFYLTPTGAEGLGNQSSGGGVFFDVTGHRCGILILQEKVGMCMNGRTQKQSLWRAGCECGGEIVAPLSKFRRGYLTSCGCVEKEHKGVKHGATSNGKITPEYSSWRSMLSRCYNKKHINYKYYGGRGIRVCNRWRYSFELFLLDMGNKPTKKHSIDRINNDGNYEEGNCRWATPKQQANNKRKRISLRGR